MLTTLLAVAGFLLAAEEDEIFNYFRATGGTSALTGKCSTAM